MHSDKEKWAESCEATSSDGKTLFDGRPDGDVECRP
jgi:hypothetical protein